MVCLFITGCNTDKKQKNITVLSNDSWGNPIEEWVVIDSTIIGRSTVAENLDVPWEITWGPDNHIWFTEQGGRVSRLNPETGELRVLLEIEEVFRKRTTGLLALAIHPVFDKSPFVFLNYTSEKEGVITSRLMRYEYANDTLVNPEPVLDIPGHTSHNGSRLTISSDNKLMWATGDIGPNVDYAQDLNSLNGKILRLNLDGSVPEDNPIPGSLIWSWGQRNVQGLTYGANGLLYSSEHGDATDDEVNLMQKGRNYGWPIVSGYCNRGTGDPSFCKDSLVVNPLKAWTPTIAPAGMDYYASESISEWHNSLLLVSLKESDLRVLELNKEGDSIVNETIFFDNALGRLRDLCISPEGDVYISTSNQDWNPKEGFPKETDDRIIRISKVGKKSDAELLKFILEKKESAEKVQKVEKTGLESEGKSRYNMYCASCHKTDGKGIENTFPSLVGSSIMTEEKNKLIQLILQGSKSLDNGSGEVMPSFTFLSDEDIAKILTYIQVEFGGRSEYVVEPAEIKEARLIYENE